MLTKCAHRWTQNIRYSSQPPTETIKEIQCSASCGYSRAERATVAPSFVVSSWAGNEASDSERRRNGLAVVSTPWPIEAGELTAPSDAPRPRPRPSQLFQSSLHFVLSPISSPLRLKLSNYVNLWRRTDLVRAAQGPVHRNRYEKQKRYVFAERVKVVRSVKGRREVDAVEEIYGMMAVARP